MEIFRIVILALSSLLLTFVGLMRLSSPIKTYLKNSGIHLNNDVNLLNEIRGNSAVMLLAGILIASGLFIVKLNLSAHLMALLIFLGFVIGRLISVKADGKPNKQITQGIAFELVLGIANVVCLISIWN